MGLFWGGFGKEQALHEFLGSFLGWKLPQQAPIPWAFFGVEFAPVHPRAQGPGPSGPGPRAQGPVDPRAQGPGLSGSKGPLSADPQGIQENKYPWHQSVELFGPQP